MSRPQVTLHSINGLITVRHGDMVVMGSPQQLAEFVQAINASLRRAEKAAAECEPLPLIMAPIDMLDV